ncbi:unnamed protein product, partial [Vitis vinifera]|uniref:Uncharacterized protein n=1 Tax=Vitis vinifera TaxID=29760 RepID=D7T6C9_VITVI
MIPPSLAKVGSQDYVIWGKELKHCVAQFNCISGLKLVLNIQTSC